jgi:hypothetical protein
VLDHVSGQQAVEAPRPSVLTGRELAGRERCQPSLPAYRDRVLVVIHSDPARGEVRQVPTQTAANVQDFTLTKQSPHVPPVRRLHAELLFPARLFKPD